MSEDGLKWAVTDRRIVLEDRWLRLRSDECVNASGVAIGSYHVLELPDWINVIAITSDGTVPLVRQYRHGIEAMCLGLPSGTVENGEAPLAAAQRELLEETGLGGGHWYLLGASLANPARQDNRIYCYVAVDVVATAQPVDEPSEEITVEHVGVRDLLEIFLRSDNDLQSIHRATILLFLAPMLSEAGIAERLIDYWRAQRSIHR